MSVVGIDFGNLNTVVAVARNRGIDVIVNETSNRATPSLVTFGDKQRFLGEAAQNQVVSNFKNTCASLKRLAGRNMQEPGVAKFEKPFVNAQLADVDGQVGVAVSFQGEQKEFTYTQLCAMFLVKVKEFTSNECKIPISDCVISCPTWFTDAQRRALIDASQVAGLNCLRLMNDTTAAALGYGITKTDLPDPLEKAKPRIVCFVDLGHSSYQVSIVSFLKGKLNVMGTACDANLGGRDYDQVLTKHYSEEFKSKYKIDIASNAKATFRLRQGAEKVKKILSANPLAMLNVECLMDDKDVSAQVKREEFLEWARPLSERLLPPIQEALNSAGISADMVDFVELVGGSTRLPVVKETLAIFFGGTIDGPNKLSTTLNQDEAVARGCALQCAILSPVFKVRDFAVHEWNASPIELEWDPSTMPPAKEGSTLTSKMAAFPIGNAVPSTKILSFTRNLDAKEVAAGNGAVDFEVTGNYGKAFGLNALAPGVDSKIGKWTIKGIKQYPSCETKDANGNVVSAKASIKIKAKLDGNGLLCIDSANQIEEYIAADSKATKDTPMGSNESLDTEGGDEKVDTDKEMKTDEKEAKGDDKAKKADDKAKKADGKEKKAEVAEPEKPKKMIHRHDLVVVAELNSVGDEKLQQWLADEGAMYASDRLVVDTAEKRNALEEYVYETRSKLEMGWSEYMVDAERSVFYKSLNDTENWLYAEGEDATKSVYAEKLVELKSVGDPVAFRVLQSEERPIAEKKFREYVNNVLIDISADVYFI